MVSRWSPSRVLVRSLLLLVTSLLESMVSATNTLAEDHLNFYPPRMFLHFLLHLNSKGDLAMSGNSEYWISQERLEDWVSFLVAKDLTARAILEGKTWNSPEIQNMVDQLRREISGTAEWAKKWAEVHEAYLVKLAEEEPNIAQSDIIERSGTLADMLERLWVNPD